MIRGAAAFPRKRSNHFWGSNDTRSTVGRNTPRLTDTKNLKKAGHVMGRPDKNGGNSAKLQRYEYEQRRLITAD
jgi:hypothetical protein